MGLEGAKAWLDVLEDNKYQSSEIEYRVTNELINTVKKVEIRSIISFGPGDGKLDSEIAIATRNSEPWLNYIPVDINQYLLAHASFNVGQQVNVPIAVLSDFEDRLNFIEFNISKYGQRPFLFTLLGGTIGNIENFERKFFDTVKSMMHKGDFFLLDVFIKGDEWKFEDDRRTKLEFFGHGQRKFLSNGLRLKTGEPFSISCL